jgi:biopolymer transport protein ExbD
MSSVDLGGSKKPAGGGPSWKRPRVNIRIDMTPMVDIAFLLLIFFMVTTVFRLPQTMEMALPENDPSKPPPKIKIGEKSLLTVMVMRIGDRDSLAYMVGTETPKPISWDSLSAKLIERKIEAGLTEITQEDTVRRPKLTVLAKIDRKANYEALVNLVDHFNVDSINRFSIDRYTTLDDSLLRAAGFATAGPVGLPEPVYASDNSE